MSDPKKNKTIIEEAIEHIDSALKPLSKANGKLCGPGANRTVRKSITQLGVVKQWLSEIATTQK
jgi:hypothetical protein